MDTPQKKPRKPGRPYHSQLAPYAAQIARWRREGQTYKEITALLAERGVEVHLDTVNSFVLVRARGGGKVAVLPEPKEPVLAAPVGPVASVQTKQPAAPAVAQKSPLAADLPAAGPDAPLAEAGPGTRLARARALLRESGGQPGQPTQYPPANLVDL